MSLPHLPLPIPASLTNSKPFPTHLTTTNHTPHRHGWGIPPSPPLALHYHTLAASNAATTELAALSSGQPRGGLAKGELVLAIYELGNAFRHGWGCEKDLVAAKKYYECAAELGDVDAMVEVAWCLERGAGGPADKFQAARYLRMAEERGRVEVGNSW